MSVEVVLGVEIFVAALSRVSAQAVRFPEMPPRTASPITDALGAFVGGQSDFALILTDEIAEQLSMVLCDDTRGLGWDFAEAARALDVLDGLAYASGGGFVTPCAARTPKGARSYSAAALRAISSEELGFPRLVVTTDPTLLTLATWRPDAGFPKDERVDFFDPKRFRDLVAKVRWELRAGGP